MNIYKVVINKMENYKKINFSVFGIISNAVLKISGGIASFLFIVSIQAPSMVITATSVSLLFLISCTIVHLEKLGVDLSNFKLIAILSPNLNSFLKTHSSL